MKDIQNVINSIPNGHSKVIFNKKTYSLTKNIFNTGKSIKLYAEELGGNDIVSCNFYKTDLKFIIKPCEMPEKKVLSFLRDMKLQE